MVGALDDRHKGLLDGASGRRRDRLAEQLLEGFAKHGFEAVTTPVFGPADPLFDLYGEEIWERAFVVEDLDRGAWALRPDFTVPVARAHMQAGGAPARYCYAGPVFRRPADALGPSGAELAAAMADPQQHQVGIEIFGEPSDAARDAEVFALTAEALAEAGAPAYDAVVGDLGVVFALLEALEMPETWRRRLRRHFRRPARFRDLLRSLSDSAERGRAGARLGFLRALGEMPPPEAAIAVTEMMTLSETPQIGVRTPREVAERVLSLAKDARLRPLPTASVDVIEAALAVSGRCADALARLRDLARGAGIDLGGPLDRLEARLEALSERGADVEQLRFDADFGRNLEYYDGFVFEMRAHDAVDAAGRPIKFAGGGRYDSLFAALAGAGGTGVGAALRPDMLVAACERAEAGAA